MLIVIGGLPGTGKSTIARELASRCRATYLRIDSIEQTLRNTRVVLAGDVGAAGYAVAMPVARDGALSDINLSQQRDARHRLFG